MMNESEFVIKEKELLEGEVSVGLAVTPQEMIGRLDVVTDRYIREGYLQGIPFARIDLEAEEVVQENGLGLLYESLEPKLFDKFLNEGLLLKFSGGQQLYLDKYHWQSAQFIAKTSQGIVGSVRLIMANNDSGINMFQLPTLTDENILIEQDWREKVANVKAELSQFAKYKDVPTSVAVALLRIAAQYSRVNGVEEWLATTDNRVVKMLNGIYFNFGLPKIGPSVRYLGSESTPQLINIEQAIQNADEKVSSRNMARFLRGENDIQGFEWYTGV